MQRVSELEARIAELYERWDPLALSAEEFHKLDDELYELEEELLRLLLEDGSCQKSMQGSSERSPTTNRRCFRGRGGSATDSG